LIAGCVLFFAPRLIGPVTALANQSWSGPSIAEKWQAGLALHQKREKSPS
jgi:hypothetical protein